MSILSAGTTNSTALNLTADTSGSLILASNNGTTAITVDTSQRVGIGTASPANKLHVSDTTTSTVKTRTQASTGYVDVGMGGNSGVFDTTGSDGIRLRMSSNDKVSIDGSTLALSGLQGIKFQATQSASSDANTLDDYQEGSYTGTLTGCTTSPTTTVYYTKIGNIVHLSNLAAGITGTSNASTMRLTGMPALIRPANASKAAVQGGISGSVSQTIWAQVLSNGDIYCESGGSSWPTSGVKGFDSGFGITYSTY
jgi:hypothetical protein